MPLMKGSVTTLPRDLFFRYNGGPPWAIRSGNRKFFATAAGPQLLFDVSGMQEKVISDPALAAQLKSRLMEWNRQLIPPLWPPG
ncbi:MAG: hypothetical protein U1E35_05760 [Rhodospirillales bacterium]